jgi:hypothetical protein
MCEKRNEHVFKKGEDFFHRTWVQETSFEGKINYIRSFVNLPHAFEVIVAW